MQHRRLHLSVVKVMLALALLAFWGLAAVNCIDAIDQSGTVLVKKDGPGPVVGDEELSYQFGLDEVIQDGPGSVVGDGPA